MSGEPCRRVVIDGAYGHRNLGDELILRGLVAMIGEPPERVSVISADPDDTARRHRTHTLRRESRYRSGGGRASPRSFLRTLRGVARAEAYVIGGGALITDERGLPPLVRQVVLSVAAGIAGVPTVILGVSIGPLETPAGRMLARRLLGRADLILTRDHQSLALAVSLVGSERVRCGPDAAFLAGFYPDDAARSRRSMLAVAVRDVPPSRGSDNRTAQRAAMVRNLARLLDAFIERHDSDVVFVPFQMLERSEVERRLDDVAIAHAVIAEMTFASRARVEEISDELALASVLRQYRVVLAQRFHAGIVALAAGTPVVTLAYHQKFAGLDHAGVGGASTQDLIAGQIDAALWQLESAWKASASTGTSEALTQRRLALSHAAGVRASLAAIRSSGAHPRGRLRRPRATRP